MRRRFLCAAATIPILGLIGFLVMRSEEPQSIPHEALTRTRPLASKAPTVAKTAGSTEASQSLTSPSSRSAESKAAQFGPPRWATRPPEEWQGMLINLNITPPCTASSECGLARACIGGRCMPCEQDQQCAAHEACVLQHCVARELVECRTAAECDADSKCILTGYSSEPRGNEGTRAYCQSAKGGVEGEEVIERPERPQPGEAHPNPTDALFQAARQAADSN